MEYEMLLLLLRFFANKLMPKQFLLSIESLVICSMNVLNIAPILLNYNGKSTRWPFHSHFSYDVIIRSNNGNGGKKKKMWRKKMKRKTWKKKTTATIQHWAQIMTDSVSKFPFSWQFFPHFFFCICCCGLIQNRRIVELGTVVVILLLSGSFQLNKIGF